MKTNICEYAEEMGVEIRKLDDDDVNKVGAGRLIIEAWNEAGYNGTEVDLLDVIAWVKENMPELLI